MRVLVQDGPSGPHAQAGQILDLPEAEAQSMMVRGTATVAPDLVAETPVAVVVPRVRKR